jgi:beta-lactamase regulating signal transducer with metallopeptidase domain
MENVAMNLLFEISRFTAQAFVSGLWQGIVLISAVSICLRLLSRVSPSGRFAVWAFAFVLMGTIPLLHFRMGAIQKPYVPSALAHFGVDWAFAIAGLWAIVTAVRVSQLLMQAIHLRRIWRRSKPVVAKTVILALLQSGKRMIKFCTSADVDAPSVIGLFSPRLLIPEWLFAKLTESELRQIVLHECEHLRRYDDWMNLLQKIGLALFPLNPALLWVDRRLSLERELACDARVVASTAAPFDYAKCLTRLAEHHICCRRVALSLSAWNRRSELARRVHSLLRPMHKMSLLRTRVSIGLLSLGLIGSTIEMARVPRLVSFTDVDSASMEEIATAPPNSVAMQALPAVYRQVAQPHGTLLKAILPSTKTSHILLPRKPIIKQQWHTELHTVRAVRMPTQPLMVLTTSPQLDAAKGHTRRNAFVPVYTLSASFSSSYAAFPFGDGWLIVQL